MVASLTRVTARGVSSSGLSRPKAALLAWVCNRWTGSPSTVMDSTPCARAAVKTAVAQSIVHPAAARFNTPRLMTPYIGIPFQKCHVTFYVNLRLYKADKLFLTILLNLFDFPERREFRRVRHRGPA